MNRTPNYYADITTPDGTRTVRGYTAQSCGLRCIELNNPDARVCHMRDGQPVGTARELAFSMPHALKPQPPRPVSERSRVSVRVDPDLHGRLAQLISPERRSVAAMVRVAIREYCDRIESHEKGASTMGYGNGNG